MKELFTKTLYDKILPNRYKIQKKCDGAVDNCLGEFKFLPDWFFTSKILEKFHEALLGNDDTLFLDENFSKVICFVYSMK